jgi:FkbM family methyltransferase
MKVRLLTVCKNERSIIPFFLQHYLPFVDEIVIADGNSTDGSAELATQLGQGKVRIINLDAGAELDDSVLMNIRNEAWKEGRENFDWQIVCDMDEFLYHPLLHHKLFQFMQQGITVPKIVGCEMYAMAFPEYGRPITEQVRRGVFNPQWLNKQIIFNPKLATVTYGMGCHTCTVEGVVNRGEEEMALLHYRNLGYDYLVRKADMSLARLSKHNKDKNLSWHYDMFSKMTREEFAKQYAQTTSMVRPDRSYFKAQDEFVFHEIFEWDVYHVAKDDLKDQIILDVGGQYGLFSTYAHDHGAKSVLAVEANPRNYLKFVRNTQQFPNVKGINVAVGAKTGGVINIDDNGGGSKTGQGDTSVAVMSLTDIVSMLPANEDIILKMDIEGAEYEALYNTSSEVLRRFKIIFIELHGPKHIGGGGGANNSVDAMVQYIMKHGFSKNWQGIYYTDYPDERGRVVVEDVYTFKFIRA